MHQQGQVFKLKSNAPDGRPLWAYRHRTGGRGSDRVQRGGFPSRRDAEHALDRALDQVRRRSQTSRRLTLHELADEYLGQHQAEPETIDNLRWLLGKSTSRFGDHKLHELSSREIAAWRMTLPTGHRFEATQALRQTLARAQQWGLIDRNPAKDGVENPVPLRREQHPFESWQDLLRIADLLAGTTTSATAPTSSSPHPAAGTCSCTTSAPVAGARPRSNSA